MSTWTIRKKLFLSNFIFLLSAVALLSLILIAKNKDIHFAELEVTGNQFQGPVEEIFRLTSLLKMGKLDKNSNIDVLALKNKIDSETKKLEIAFKESESALQLNAEGLRSRNRSHIEWKVLSQSIAKIKTSDNTIEDYNKILADLRTLITHIGDTSNLILDPDLDSYYLMDVTLLAFPQMQDRMQQIHEFNTSLLSETTLSEANKVKLKVFAALLQQADLDRLKASFETSLNEDEKAHGVSPTLKTNLEPKMTAYLKTVQAQVDLLNRLSNEQNSELVKKYLEMSSMNFSESFKVWNAASIELNLLLNNRIAVIQRTKNLFLGLGLAVILMALFLSIYISYNINKEVSKYINDLRESLSSNLGLSRKLNSVSTALSAGSQQESAAIEETVATLTEINSMVERSQEFANQTLQSVVNSNQSVKTGQAKAQQAETALQEIESSNKKMMSEIGESTKKIQGIVEIITNIGEKTKIINDIVFQTKLLSFNASVEAARAGEHGAGFSIVAQEVGNLANMSGNASKEISDMLSSSSEKVEEIVNDLNIKIHVLLQEGNNKISKGTNIVKECSSELTNIVKEVNGINAMIEEITKAQDEQAKGVNEITKAMQQLDEASHNNSQVATETTSYAHSIKEQAEQLQGIIYNLEKMVSTRRAKRNLKNFENTMHEEQEEDNFETEALAS